MQDAFMTHWRRLNDRLRALALRKSRKSSIDARGLVMLRETPESQSENLVPRDETSARVCVFHRCSQECLTHSFLTASRTTE
jgi:hypothetical protein